MKLEAVKGKLNDKQRHAATLVSETVASSSPPTETVRFHTYEV